MKTRPLILTGLALASLAGCQSYFPNGGYGSAGPYSAYPQGTFNGPPPGGQPPTTFQPGRMPPPGAPTTAVPGLKNESVPSNGQRAVPNPSGPGSESAPLGADEENATIRRGTSSLEKAPARLDGLNDDDAAMSAFGNPDFVAPREVRSVSAIDDGDEMPKIPGKPRPNPYKFDPEGYTWLRGIVTPDPQGVGWRIKYSDNPLDDDQYGGSLKIVGDEKIESLLEEDVVLVKGRVDTSARDRNGKPVYRVENLQRLKPRL
jgi:hypothetical protein